MSEINLEELARILKRQGEQRRAEHAYSMRAHEIDLEIIKARGQVGRDYADYTLCGYTRILCPVFAVVLAFVAYTMKKPDLWTRDVVVACGLSLVMLALGAVACFRFCKAREDYTASRRQLFRLLNRKSDLELFNPKEKA